MEEHGPDFIVSDLLAELKRDGERKDRLIHGLVKVICGSGLAILGIVASFLIYLNQYDFSSYSEIDANGVYALVDSEGNVIAHDLSPEEIEAIMEVLDGNSQSEDSEIED